MVGAKLALAKGKLGDPSDECVTDEKNLNATGHISNQANYKIYTEEVGVNAECIVSKSGIGACDQGHMNNIDSSLLKRRRIMQKQNRIGGT